MSAAAEACRRCSECWEGEEHHWMDDCPEDTGPIFICKHCPATSEAVDCNDCGEMFPAAVSERTDDGNWHCINCAPDLGAVEEPWEQDTRTLPLFPEQGS